jgi:uroporphyrin-III C-methyltransferase
LYHWKQVVNASHPGPGYFGSQSAHCPGHKYRQGSLLRDAGLGKRPRMSKLPKPADFPPGSVWLVGAGPGDAELLTRKAARLIRAASVIFHDALVGPGILEMAAPGARLVHVGKRSGRHSQEQQTIDQLIVDAALGGERVVRLKGGDPAIFGRASEELAACRAAAVPVRICPGVTAASAAAAALGTSLTLRGLARKLVFVTAHVRDNDVLELDWQALADPQATLAVYMGKAAAPILAARLLAAGLPGETSVAMVENASLPDERVFRTRLDRLPLAAHSWLGDGPALLLIGEAIGAVGLAIPLFGAEGEQAQREMGAHPG